MGIDLRDQAILRDLARRVAEIAALPVMEERRALWKQHNDLKRVRPMLLIFPEGAWGELVPERALACEDEAARRIEIVLRQRIYTHEYLRDDFVFEPTWVVTKHISSTGWGLAPRQKSSADPRGAWGFDPVIRTEDDLEKLQYPELTYEAEATDAELAVAHDLFDGILRVELKGPTHLSFHLMALYTSLRGLEQVLLDMCLYPEMLHRAMAFLEEGHRRLIEQWCRLNLLSLNNDDSYQSSGGVGYTDALPAAGFDPERVRPCDVWASAEAQEMAPVSPAMHEEFVLQYERRLLAPFGLNGYGCCEDLTDKLDYVFTIPNLRRISISPFARVEPCAERLGNRYIYSWKPQPAHLVGGLDEAMIRRYIRHTVDVARDSVLEIILKDTHTCEQDPSRFTRWSEIAREVIEES